MSDNPMDFTFAVTQDGGVVLDGVPVEEAQELSSPVEDSHPVDGEVERLRRERDEARNQLEAFAPILRRIGNGTIPIPEMQQPPDPEALQGYQARLAIPGSAEIVEALYAYARTLPPHVARELDSDPRMFNATFDAFVAGRRPPPSKQQVDHFMRSREASKDAARSLRSGIAPEFPVDDGNHRKVVELKKRIARGHRDSEIELAKIFMGDDG